MKTITPPIDQRTSEPEPEPTPTWTFDPAATLRPFEIDCANHACRAVLEIDSEHDLRYLTVSVLAGRMVRFLLDVVCPHCGSGRVVEEYAQPGNPARHTPVPGWRNEIPLAARSRAYRAWEREQTPEFWEAFFNYFPEVRYWAENNPRAARKMRSRLSKRT